MSEYPGARYVAAIQRYVTGLWHGLTFEQKMRSAMIAILLNGLIVAGFSYWKSLQTEYLLERSRLAHQVLQTYLQLSNSVSDLTRLVTAKRLNPEVVEGAVEPDNELVVSINAQMKRLRSLIADEIVLVAGKDDDEDEREEFERLTDIERSITLFTNTYARNASATAGQKTRDYWLQLDTAVRANFDDVFRERIKVGIQDEAKEVDDADLRGKRLILVSQRLILLAAIAGLFATIALAKGLARSMRRPLTELQTSLNAFAKGDFAARVPVRGHDEFAVLATRFNEMTSELERRKRGSDETRESLEREVADRTRGLMELNVSLASADQTRRRFMADLSHELRTPLTIIRGESEIMLRGAEAPAAEYRLALTRILEQAKHTTALVDDLLFIARKESGESRLRMQAIDIRRFFQQVCQEAKPLCVMKELHLECTVPDANLPSISADPVRLRQVFFVLLDNAIRYSKKNGKIEARLMATPDGVAILVSDNGIGISSEDLPFVFERFYRGNNAGAQSVEGVGLGLPVAKAIVDAHGGTLVVDSELERGTKVTLTLSGLSGLKAIA